MKTSCCKCSNGVGYFEINCYLLYPPRKKQTGTMNHHFRDCWRRSLQDGLGFDCCWCLWKYLKEMPSSPCPSILHESVKFSNLTLGQKIIEEIQAKAVSPEGLPQCLLPLQESLLSKAVYCQVSACL